MEQISGHMGATYLHWHRLMTQKRKGVTILNKLLNTPGIHSVEKKDLLEKAMELMEEIQEAEKVLRFPKNQVEVRELLKLPVLQKVYKLFLA